MTIMIAAGFALIIVDKRYRDAAVDISKIKCV